MVETFVKVLLIESKIVLTILFRGPFVEVLVDVTAKKIVKNSWSNKMIIKRRQRPLHVSDLPRLELYQTLMLLTLVHLYDVKGRVPAGWGGQAMFSI